MPQRRVPCKWPNCKFSSPAIQSMISHVNGVHLKIRPFKCTYPGCTKDFTSDALRRLHASHHDEKSFKCDYPGCTMAYSTISSLRAHKRDKHGANSIKLHQPCPIDKCGETFEHCEELITHMQSKHPFEHENNTYVVPALYLSQIKSKFSFMDSMSELELNEAGVDEDFNYTDPFEDDIEQGYSPELTAYLLLRNTRYIEHHRKTWSGLRSVIRDHERTHKSQGDRHVCTGVDRKTCPYDAEIELGTSLLRINSREGRFDWGQICYLCEQIKVNKETRKITMSNKTKLDAQGNPLCAATKACPELRKPGVFFCAIHSSAFLQSQLKNRANNLLETNTRTGKGSKIKDAADMKKYLDVNHLSIPFTLRKPFAAIANVIQRNEQVFVIDLEFILSSIKNTVLEICVKDLVTGSTIVNTTVNYDCSIRDMYNAVENRFQFGTIMRLYGPPSDEPTPGMTPLEIATLLRNAGMNKHGFLLEWSTSRCDYTLFRKMLEDVGADDILPINDNSILMINAWRRALPGFFSFGLGIAFTFVFPKRTDLVENAHRAEPDTDMLRLMTLVFLRHVFWKKDGFVSLLQRLSGDALNDSLYTLPILSATEQLLELEGKTELINAESITSLPIASQQPAPTQPLVSHSLDSSGGYPTHSRHTRLPLTELESNPKRSKITNTKTVHPSHQHSAPESAKTFQAKEDSVIVPVPPPSKNDIRSFFQVSNASSIPPAPSSSAREPAKHESKAKSIKAKNAKSARAAPPSSMREIRSLF